jgi:hypothetical protein
MKTQWTAPIEWADGLARPQLRGADRRAARHGRDRSLLPGVERGSGRTLEAAAEPRRDLLVLG